MSSLEISNFAHLAKVDVEFGDFTVLVGPQATGKSLVLQLWKLIQDQDAIQQTLRDAGFAWADGDEFLERCLGEGWAGVMGADTSVRADGRPVTLESLAKKKRGLPRPESVFFIPAHRTLIFENGWPRTFQQFPPDTPVVVRLFSERLHELMVASGSGKADAVLFPQTQRLKYELRQILDDAAFHGGELRLSRRGMQKRLTLHYPGAGGSDGAELGFMSWTTGQRELIPLLLSLYHLLPVGRLPRAKNIDWVILEEPELGLHPQATFALMMMILDLLGRGYRVVIATHAPAVLDLVFAIKRLQDHDASRAQYLKVLGLPNKPGVNRLIGDIADKTFRVFSFEFGAKHSVTTQDISSLDPGSAEKRESGWGGLTGLSGDMLERLGEVLSGEK